MFKNIVIIILIIIIVVLLYAIVGLNNYIESMDSPLTEALIQALIDAISE